MIITRSHLPREGSKCVREEKGVCVLASGSIHDCLSAVSGDREGARQGVAMAAKIQRLVSQARATFGKMGVEPAFSDEMKKLKEVVRRRGRDVCCTHRLPSLCARLAFASCPFEESI